MNPGRIKEFFTLDLKKMVLVVASFLLFVVLHNLFYAATGIEEGVFFILAVLVVPLYAIAATICTLYRRFRPPHPKS